MKGILWRMTAILGALFFTGVACQALSSETAVPPSERSWQLPMLPRTVLPSPTPEPEVAGGPEEEPPAPIYYSSCVAAKRAGGDLPLRRGDSGYRSGLDRDGDGVACEN
mgnify:CR=1 FL=1